MRLLTKTSESLHNNEMHHLTEEHNSQLLQLQELKEQSSYIQMQQEDAKNSYNLVYEQEDIPTAKRQASRVQISGGMTNFTEANSTLTMQHI